MKCKICSSSVKMIFTHEILNKYNIKYFQCTSCFFIQTEDPFWLDEAYKSSINLEDTGLLDRNILFAKRSTALIYFLFNKEGIFLDFAGGYGLFVRLMRDYGFNFYWNDIYTENILAKGFEYDPAENKDIELITAFECFEHFSDPVKEIDKMLSCSSNLLFSTEIFSKEAPPIEWDYYGFSHGQHISFYSIESLLFIARKYKLHLYSNRKSFHLLTNKKISNAAFNILLKASLFGLPLIIKKFMRSKTLSDSKYWREQHK